MQGERFLLDRVDKVEVHSSCMQPYNSEGGRNGVRDGSRGITAVTVNGPVLRYALSAGKLTGSGPSKGFLTMSCLISLGAASNEETLPGFPESLRGESNRGDNAWELPVGRDNPGRVRGP